MYENQLATAVLDAAFKIHRKLGPGLLEAVYEEIMQYELERMGYGVTRQEGVPLTYDELSFRVSYRADLIIEDQLIVELKSVSKVLPVDYKRLLTYLRLKGIKLGLLINFNEVLLKNGIKRVID